MNIHCTKLQFVSGLLSAFFFFGGCSSVINAEKKPPLPQYIGTATMEENGDLVLVLHGVSDDGAMGQALFRYTKGSPGYENVLQHVGGLKPGESKGVVPWPDPKER